jgi:tetratricopeptide (TPR) repeat protein
MSYNSGTMGHIHEGVKEIGMGRRLGLIIGANQYHDTTFQPLQFAENDARAFAQWLVNVKGGKWTPSDVQLVLGELATRELVESLLTQMCVSIAGPQDLVLIYFAGHTFVDERTGEGYLALVNTSSQEPLTGIHLLSLVQSILARSRAAHLLLVLDCFQTGQLWNVRRTSPYDFKPLLGSTSTHVSQQQGNRLFFCSCRGNEAAPEAGERGLGLFMYRVIVGLCGPASDPTTGNITLQQLYAFLASTLGEQQRPHLFGKEQYPLVLVGDTPLTFTPPQLSPSAGTSTQTPSTPRSRQNMDIQPGESVNRFTTATVQRPPQPTSMNAEQEGKLLLNQAQQLVQMQNQVEALHVVEQALQFVPQDVGVLTLKCQILGTLGRFQEALSIVEQLVQRDPQKALTWSMRAALLTNIGQYQTALTAIDRSLGIDPQNPETHAIKNNIEEHLATAAVRESTPRQRQASSPDKKRGGPRSFFIGVGLQIAGLVIGLIGGILLIISPGLPGSVGFGLESFGLALLCVNAARGAYRYGILRLLVVLLFCLAATGILGAVYKFGYTRLVAEFIAHPSIFVPVLFLAMWLTLAATLPLILAVGGYIGGLVLGVRRRGK